MGDSGSDLIRLVFGCRNFRNSMTGGRHPAMRLFPARLRSMRVVHATTACIVGRVESLAHPPSVDLSIFRRAWTRPATRDLNFAGGCGPAGRRHGGEADRLRKRCLATKQRWIHKYSARPAPYANSGPVHRWVSFLCCPSEEARGCAVWVVDSLCGRAVDRSGRCHGNTMSCLTRLEEALQCLNAAWLQRSADDGNPPALPAVASGL